MIKECGPCTAVVAIPILGLLVLLLFPVIRLVLFIVQRFIRHPAAHSQFHLVCWLLWENLLWDLAYLVWAICTRMSCSFNVFGKIKRLFFSKNVNFAMVHDSADQVTPTYLPTDLPFYLSTYLPTYLPTCMHAYIHTHIRGPGHSGDEHLLQSCLPGLCRHPVRRGSAKEDRTV